MRRQVSRRPGPGRKRGRAAAQRQRREHASGTRNEQAKRAPPQARPGRRRRGDAAANATGAWPAAPQPASSSRIRRAAQRRRGGRLPAAAEGCVEPGRASAGRRRVERPDVLHPRHHHRRGRCRRREPPTLVRAPFGPRRRGDDPPRGVPQEGPLPGPAITSWLGGLSGLPAADRKGAVAATPGGRRPADDDSDAIEWPSSATRPSPAAGRRGDPAQRLRQRRPPAPRRNRRAAPARGAGCGHGRGSRRSPP